MVELTDRELEQRVAEAMGWERKLWDPPELLPCWPPIKPEEVWVQPQGIFAWPTAEWHPLTNKAQAWEVLEWLRQQSSALIIDKRHVCVHLTEPPYTENVRQAWHTDLARAVCLAAVEVGRKEAE